MSSFYDDASLVVIPSGYKTSKIYAEKPTDGSGDLTLTRASDATRVGPNGLIEKVRTNLVTYSNSFSNAAWDNIGSSETSGQTGYDGTTNAWSLIEDSSTGNHLTRQFPTLSGLSTISVYAKAGTRSFLYLRGVQSSANVIGWFNLSTGALGTIQTNGTGKIESVGNGWYRCSLTIANFESGFEIYVGLSSTDAVTSYAGNGTGNILIQNAQVETGDIATSYIPTTTAAVSVGPVSNVPRLDYLGSTCPRLNLEPQRTNLLTFSEQLDNASVWYSDNTTITANIATSPDGTQNADRFATTAANGYFTNAVAVTISANASTYTQSIFVKWVSGSEVIKLRTALTDGVSVAFNSSINIRTGVVISTDTTAQVVSYGNGWYRVSHQATNNSTNTNFAYQIYPTNDATNTNVIYLWGAQIEAGAYATSYIPTLAASVTRVADAASKTGISSLIGQTAGTIFLEVDYSLPSGAGGASARFQLSDGSTGEWMLVSYPDAGGSAPRFYINNGGSDTNVGSSANMVQGTNKIAAAYQNGDYVLYLNGVQVGASSASIGVPSTSRIDMQGNVPSDATVVQGAINQALLFKTRLTNSQLAELTTL